MRWLLPLTIQSNEMNEYCDYYISMSQKHTMFHHNLLRILSGNAYRLRFRIQVRVTLHEVKTIQGVEYKPDYIDTKSEFCWSKPSGCKSRPTMF